MRRWLLGYEVFVLGTQQANGLQLVLAAVARVCYSESGAESAGSSSTHQVRTLTNSRIPAAASSRP